MEILKNKIFFKFNLGNGLDKIISKNLIKKFIKKEIKFRKKKINFFHFNFLKIKKIYILEKKIEYFFENINQLIIKKIFFKKIINCINELHKNKILFGNFSPNIFFYNSINKKIYLINFFHFESLISNFSRDLVLIKKNFFIFPKFLNFFFNERIKFSKSCIEKLKIYESLGRYK